MIRAMMGQKKKLFTKRFFPAGNYTWVVPPGCTEVDVFLVGGGAGNDSNYICGAGSGYTKTFKKDAIGWRDGGAIKVTTGQSIPIIVGSGTTTYGEYSQFLNLSYRALGGDPPSANGSGGSGGSGGGCHCNPSIGGSKAGDGGNDGATGGKGEDPRNFTAGLGQGHTTRDFGELTGKRNAGAGAGLTMTSNGTISNNSVGGESDYYEGSGGGDANRNGKGYGGGAGGRSRESISSKGGDGTVLIRYYAYHE